MRKYQPIPPIDGCSEWPKWYRAGDDGTVWSRRKRGTRPRGFGKWRRLRQTVQTANGSLKPKVRLIRDGSERKPTFIAVDLCICMAFKGPRPDGHVPRHWPDPSPLNCRADNLEWAPGVERRLSPKPETDRTTSRITNPRHRPVARNALHEALVLKIRADHACGETTKQICEKHGLKYNIVRDVIIRRTWKNVDPEEQKRH